MAGAYACSVCISCLGLTPAVIKVASQCCAAKRMQSNLYCERVRFTLYAATAALMGSALCSFLYFYVIHLCSRFVVPACVTAALCTQLLGVGATTPRQLSHKKPTAAAAGRPAQQVRAWTSAELARLPSLADACCGACVTCTLKLILAQEGRCK